MTPVCTTLCKLEGDCDGQLRDYVVTGRNGRPVQIDGQLNPETGKPLTVRGSVVQICDKHYLYLDTVRPDLLFRRVDDPLEALMSLAVIDAEDDEHEKKPSPTKIEHDVVHHIQLAMEAAVKVYGFSPTLIPAEAWKSCQDSIEAAIAAFMERLKDPDIFQAIAEQE